MKKANIGILVSILGLLLPLISYGAESYKPFIPKEYSPNDVKISQAEFRNGDTLIKIIQAKTISQKYELPPFLCRAWLDVTRSKKLVFRRYFDDIEALGSSFGLFVPGVQPPSPFFAVVKNGDYDGRLFLVREDGKVFDLLGGFYFISENKRYLFSHYFSVITFQTYLAWQYSTCREVVSYSPLTSCQHTSINGIQERGPISSPHLNGELAPGCMKRRMWPIFTISNHIR